MKCQGAEDGGNSEAKPASGVKAPRTRGGGWCREEHRIRKTFREKRGKRIEEGRG